MTRLRSPPTAGARTTRTDALALVGLARRAGAVVTGTGAVRDAVRSGSARLVLLAEDAAAGQVGKVTNLLRHREVSRRVWGTQEELGRAVGSAPLSAIAITDDGLAGRLLQELPAGEDLPEGSDSDEEG